MRDLDELFAALAQNRFRSRFRLGERELSYLARKSLPVVLEEGRQFLLDRLAPANPANDGRQTPMRGHPIFVAQHATATCCRGCLSEWHHIPKGRELTTGEVDYAVQIISCWISRTHAVGLDDNRQRQGRLFQ